MIGDSTSTSPIGMTTHRVVLPFYGYAALALLVASILLVSSSADFTASYFHPHILAITHMMTLGWGTMIILGASHQLIPVLLEGPLYSQRLAYFSFFSAGAGIPALVYGFYVFNLSVCLVGAVLIILAVLFYLFNLIRSLSNGRYRGPEVYFVLTAALWLLITMLLGFLLLMNFIFPLLGRSSIDLLSLHAHMGIIGWFLMLIMGVGSRLIPMFLISKYSSRQRLWLVYSLTNAGLMSYLAIFLFSSGQYLYFIPLLLLMFGVAIFLDFCYQAYRRRIRRKVDDPLKISLLSVLMILIPIILVIYLLTTLMLNQGEKVRLVTAYGFVIFFGWITAIILGMTFKTLPFIIWNKVYRGLAGKIKTPNPVDLFDSLVFRTMAICYISGFILFTAGILLASTSLLKGGAVALLLTAVLYCRNVFLLMNHKFTL